MTEMCEAFSRDGTCVGVRQQEMAQTQDPVVKVAVRRNSSGHRTNMGDVKRKWRVYRGSRNRSERRSMTQNHGHPFTDRSRRPVQEAQKTEGNSTE